jgi:hypothetical protein
LWVNVATSAYCEEQTDTCSSTGTYSANSSTSYKYVNSLFNITYADGSTAGGDYAEDTFEIANTTVHSLEFGIGYTSTSAQGVLGIGYTNDEATLQTYRNLPARLASDGTISSNAYSLWLNDLYANTGQILFGGVDTDHFSGTLETIPIQAEDGEYVEFMITLTAVSLGGSTIADDEALAVLLDSGSSLTYLPDAWAASIYEQVGAEYDDEEEAAFVVCSLAESSTTLDFTFSSPTITVSMEELVIPVYNTDGSLATFDNGTTLCVLGIAPSTSGTNVMGDTFLRSAYVVYDLANNEISLAQTIFNATTHDIQEIASGSDPVTATAWAGYGETDLSGTSGSTSDGSGQGSVASSLASSTALLFLASSLGALLALV